MFAKDLDHIIQKCNEDEKEKHQKKNPFDLKGYTRRSARSSKDAWLPRCMSSNVMKEKGKAPKEIRGFQN